MARSAVGRLVNEKLETSERDSSSCMKTENAKLYGDLVPANCAPKPLQSAGCTIVQDSPQDASTAPNLRDSADECWCGLPLHQIKSGDIYFQHCPIHGSAYVQDAIEIARHLPRPA